jgi:tripartite-type tricarboxylate transporter receptor subunit TctC
MRKARYAIIGLAMAVAFAQRAEAQSYPMRPVIVIVAGHADVMFDDLVTALPLVCSRKLRALGISTAQRVATGAEIPPLAEVGLPGFDASPRQMVIAPRALPKEILNRLNAEFRAIMSELDMQQDFAGRGLIPYVSPYVSAGPDALQRFVKSEIVRWATS